MIFIDDWDSLTPKEQVELRDQLDEALREQGYALQWQGVQCDMDSFTVRLLLRELSDFFSRAGYRTMGAGR